MAIPTAYGTTNKYNPVIEEFTNDLGAWVPSWQTFCGLETENAAAKRVYAEIPVGDIPTWNGEADLTPIGHGATHTTSVTADTYGGRIVINEIEESRDPGLIGRMAGRLSEAVKRKLEKLVYAKLMLAFSETVDDGAESTSVVVSTGDHKLLVGDQANLLTSALAASSLADAREILAGWQNYNNEPLNLDKLPMALVCHPTLGDLARRLVGSPQHAQAVSGSVGATGAQINPMNSTVNPERSITVTESAYCTESGNDAWFLICKPPQTPLKLWVPTPPSLEIMRDAKDRNWSISVVFEAKAYYRAPVDGIVGSNP